MKHIKQFGRIFESSDLKKEEIVADLEEYLLDLKDEELCEIITDVEDTYGSSTGGADIVISIFHHANMWERNKALEKIENSEGLDLGYVINTLTAYYEWKQNIISNLQIGFERLKESYPELEFKVDYNEEEIIIYVYIKKGISTNFYIRRGNQVMLKALEFRKYFGVTELKFSIDTSGPNPTLKCFFDTESSYRENIGEIVKLKNPRGSLDYEREHLLLSKESPEIEGEPILTGVGFATGHYGRERRWYGVRGQTTERIWYVSLNLNPKFTFSLQ